MVQNKKSLNKRSAKTKSMKLSGEELTKAIKEAQKDPKFMKEIREFVKVTTGVYDLE